MAHPTGTFHYPTAGVLRIFLSARWSYTASDFGNPDEVDGNVRIRAYFGVSGSYKYTSTIDKFTQSSFVDVAYPGGDVVWNIGTETVDYTVPPPLTTVALRDIRVAWELVKK